MPYRTIENMARQGEKLAPFITVENLIGMLVLGTLGYTLGGAWGGLWQTLMMALGAGLGYLATLDHRGMALYQRLLWQLRGAVRGWIHGPIITPNDLPGSTIQIHIPVARRDGVVRLRPAISQIQARQGQRAQAMVAALRATRPRPGSGGSDADPRA